MRWMSCAGETGAWQGARGGFGAGLGTSVGPAEGAPSAFGCQKTAGKRRTSVGLFVNRPGSLMPSPRCVDGCWSNEMPNRPSFVGAGAGPR